MKKTVKGLIIAASVAAVVGVGAVSFAQWQAGSTEPKEVTGTTGSIVTMGAITATDDLNGKVLVPYDQTVANQYDATTMAKEMTITLSYDGAEGATLKMQASGTVGAKLEYQTDADADTWATFTTAVEVETGSIKVRLNSSTTDDMKKDYKITFTAEAPTVE